MIKREFSGGYQPKSSNLGDVPPNATTNVRYALIPNYVDIKGANKMDRIKIEEITKDKIADRLLQGEQVYCISPYYRASDDYGIYTDNLLLNSMYKNKDIINNEGARFFIVKVSPSYIEEKESENNE